MAGLQKRRKTTAAVRTLEGADPKTRTLNSHWKKEDTKCKMSSSSKTQGQVPKPSKKHPRGGGPSVLPVAAGPRPPWPTPPQQTPRQAPQSAIASHAVGKLSLAQTFNTRFLPADVPSQFLSRPCPASSAWPRLRLSATCPTPERSRSGAQVMRVSRPAGKGSSAPTSQSCTTEAPNKKNFPISSSYAHTEHLKANDHLKELRLGIQLKYTRVLSSP